MSYVRGNHDRLDLYEKYSHAQADFAFTHQGWRFVFFDAIGNRRGLTETQLKFVEREFQQASESHEETVLCLHVSPWEDNEKGRGAYNQIGEGRDRLVELLNQHQVLFCLSGHYHRGLWHHVERSTHYLVFGGTAQVKHGWLGWCLFDVYPDRVVIHQKPVYVAYERVDSAAFYKLNYGKWTSCNEAQQRFPYASNLDPPHFQDQRPATLATNMRVSMWSSLNSLRLLPRPFHISWHIPLAAIKCIFPFLCFGLWPYGRC